MLCTNYISGRRYYKKYALIFVDMSQNDYKSLCRCHVL